MARTHGDVLGTRFGRDWHRRRNEAICDPCRLAWNEATRARLASARALGWVRPGREVPKVRRLPSQCTKCGKAIKASSETPTCALCRGNRPGYSIKLSPAARLVIYERDEWTCTICLEPVDPAEPVNSTWDATLDHIVPRSQGGTDDPENLRLAHRWCNAVRGNLSHHDDGDLRVA